MMMDHMSGMMMWGMGLVWVLLIIVLILAAAALVKYLIAKWLAGLAARAKH
jgi:hypothetical protein